MPAKLADVDAHEGPVYIAEEDALYFTSVPAPAVAIKRLALTTGAISVVRGDANKANGMALAPDGRLVVCEQGERRDRARISLLDRRSGRSESIVDDWNGRPFNSPNDVVVKGDGTIPAIVVWHATWLPSTIMIPRLMVRSSNAARSEAK
jgi:gluconolactonase